jgi:hypothetical protein
VLAVEELALRHAEKFGDAGAVGRRGIDDATDDPAEPALAPAEVSGELILWAAVE